NRRMCHTTAPGIACACGVSQHPAVYPSHTRKGVACPQGVAQPPAVSCAAGPSGSLPAGGSLNYLGPPFNEPDFNPPRLAWAERVPSATVDFDLWRGLTDNARLAANYRAYSRLLCYLRGLDGQAGTAELRHSLGHFCSSLQGLVVSIAGVMSSLGYPLPAGTAAAGPPAPAGAPASPNDFLKKMDDFWLLKELQTWLWRSAKDFNRLKKKVPPAVVTLRLEAQGF
uniref:Cardiotrophin-like cytokine factor 1 n=1 Tax=Apteryx owenii TaxID=8824 RepID=A0A8B9SG47_APTOW